MTVTGEIKRKPSLDKEIYLIQIQGGLADFIKENDGWIIGVYNQQGRLLFRWISADKGDYQTAVELINAFIHINRKSTNPIFQKAFLDVTNDIERKYFNSDLGTIILHTRRHPIGTEGVIEVPDKGIILRYLWERETGSISPENLKELSSLPF
jgi:hypothetical protein